MQQICPKCGKDQGTPAAECRKCGIVFAKYRVAPGEAGPSLHPAEPARGSAEPTLRPAEPRLRPAEPSASSPQPGGFVRYRAPEPPKRRSLGAVVLTMLAFAAITGAGVLLFFNVVREGEAYGEAAHLATTHPDVLRYLQADTPEQVAVARFFPFNIETVDDAGTAFFSLPVEGPAATGVVRVALRLERGEWSVSDAHFALEGSTGSWVLVQGGELAGAAAADTDELPAVAGAGLTAQELLASDVDTWGGPTSQPEAASGAAALSAPSPAAARARPQCPYTGSSSSSVQVLEASELRGEVRRSAGCVTLVTIWGAWCPTCREHFPYVTALAERYQSDGLAFHSFATDPRSAPLEEFLRDQPRRAGTFRIEEWKDGELNAGVQAFGARYPGKVPFFALLDRRGQVVIQGGSGVYPRLEAEIRRLL